MYLESIENHFSYQNQANSNFTLNTIPSPVDINFFKAQSLSIRPFLKLTPYVPRKSFTSTAGTRSKLDNIKFTLSSGTPPFALFASTLVTGRMFFFVKSVPDSDLLLYNKRCIYSSTLLLINW